MTKTRRKKLSSLKLKINGDNHITEMEIVILKEKTMTEIVEEETETEEIVEEGAMKEEAEVEDKVKKEATAEKDFQVRIEGEERDITRM